MKKSLALALLLTLGSTPVVATVCDFLCLPADVTSRDHDCDTARHPSSTGAAIQSARGASCSHVSSTPLLAALKKSTEAQRPATALAVTSHPPAENISAALAGPLRHPIALEATALQIPLRI